MSGAGRGVTPGAGSDESAASPEPDQDRPAGADNAAEASGRAQAEGAQAGGAQADGARAAAAAGDPPDGKGPAPAPKRPGRRTRKKRSFWREFPVLVVVALLLAVVIKTYAVQAFFIPSGSMENTLQVNDRVLVNKLVYDVRSIHRGDIVVFNGDGSWDPGTVPTDSNFLVKFANGFASMFGFGHRGDILIKRVIGLPGDKVACCDAKGRVTVNGVPLAERSYLYPGNSPSESRFSVVSVPPGRLWVMGDHRLISDDSRSHLGQPGGGTIPESAVIGRAFVIIWPLSRWRILPIPGTFEQPKLNAAGAGGPAARGDTAGPLPARLEPSSPALPLALGFTAAVPVTWLQRRARLRLAGRRTARRAARERGAARHGDPDHGGPGHGDPGHGGPGHGGPGHGDPGYGGPRDGDPDYRPPAA